LYTNNKSHNHRFFNELSNNTVPGRFNSVVVSAYTISALIFIVVSATGFLTFGSISDGLILNNYSTQDNIMTLSRAAVALSLVFTYPLPFVGLRDGVLALGREFIMEKKDEDSIDTVNVLPESSSSSSSSSASTTAIVANDKEDSFAVTTIISLLLLGTVTLGAELISDLKLVLAVGGGTFSTAVASVFPALMFRSAMLQKHKREDDIENDSSMTAKVGNDTVANKVGTGTTTSAISTQSRQWESLEIKFVTALMGLSITIGATGVYRALESAMEQQS
jgi:amino acid permease